MSDRPPELSWIQSGYQISVSFVSTGVSGVRVCKANPQRWYLLLTAATTTPTPCFFPNGMPSNVMTAGFLNGTNFLELTFTAAPGLIGVEWWANSNAGATVAVLEVNKVG